MLFRSTLVQLLVVLMLLSLQLIAHLFLVHAQKSRPVEYSLETILGGQIGDGMKATNVGMYRPYGLAVDKKNGNIYYAESAGGGSLTTSGVPALSARLSYPVCIAVSPKDEIFICDNNNIRKIVNDTFYNVVGNGQLGNSPDGTPAVTASIKTAYGIAFHPVTGEMYFSDINNNVIRYVASNGTLLTYVSIVSPGAIVFDSNGNLFALSLTKGQVIKISNGVKTVIANNAGVVGFSGDGGSALNARFTYPSGLALYGNSLYVSDFADYRIRKIDLVLGNINTVAGDGSIRYQVLSGNVSNISLLNPVSTFYNSKRDELLVVDSSVGVVLKLNSVANYGNSLVDRVAGTGIIELDTDGKLGNLTSLYTPISVTQSESSSDIYIGTTIGIKKLTDSNKLISSFAGSQAYSSGDGYPATAARLSSPEGIAISTSGEVFISDKGSHTIRKIDSKGVISNVAGTGSAGYVDGPALKPKQPIDTAALLRKHARNLYPDSSDRQIIRKLFPRVKSIKRRLAPKSVDNVVKSLSDASSFDCARYCAGSTGDYKVSCYHHCMRYNL
ncbi:predicted protein [Naegleria gruberi]|uniref:Predicted protein n=1 Tax=Naegleria gruberi TaxID=5762 RepID=D2W4U7_NAEGR|nr:uncharacterized protein NAEGRDRAFT_76433 [Naegleria gruberi]EFC35905.1 predicted protein [Naegleria gruberi]|eukprot:XP_002668649.1 predicted protein [Naegleria gruberi strain NEG-M]